MLNTLIAKQTSLLGIDISSSAVRLLELSKLQERYVINAYAYELLPEEVDEEKKTEAVADVIKQALKNAKTKTRRAAIAVPDSSVITKIIQLDKGLVDEDMEELVALEADKYIPFSLEDVSLDYNILGESAKGEAYVDVLVVASRSENVNAKVELLSQCGLEVVVVDVESYATERACDLLADSLPKKGENQTIAVVDIGELNTKLTVLHNMTTVFAREQSFGGKQLTDEIIRRYNLSREAAMKGKVQGNLPEDYQSEVLEPFKQMTVLQIKRTLQFFFSSSQFSTIDYLLLAGGCAQIEGLAELIKTETDFPTMIADPIKDMKLAKHLDLSVLSQDAAAMLTVCGLALRKFE